MSTESDPSSTSESAIDQSLADIIKLAQAGKIPPSVNPFLAAEAAAAEAAATAQAAASAETPAEPAAEDQPPPPSNLRWY
jgi:hypothetical protein